MLGRPGGRDCAPVNAGGCPRCPGVLRLWTELCRLAARADAIEQLKAAVI
jgi:hypothetical protein